MILVPASAQAVRGAGRALGPCRCRAADTRCGPAWHPPCSEPWGLHGTGSFGAGCGAGAGRSSRERCFPGRGAGCRREREIRSLACWFGLCLSKVTDNQHNPSTKKPKIATSLFSGRGGEKLFCYLTLLEGVWMQGNKKEFLACFAFLPSLSTTAELIPRHAWVPQVASGAAGARGAGQGPRFCGWRRVCSGGATEREGLTLACSSERRGPRGHCPGPSTRPIPGVGQG